MQIISIALGYFDHWNDGQINNLEIQANQILASIEDGHLIVHTLDSHSGRREERAWPRGQWVGYEIKEVYDD